MGVNAALSYTMDFNSLFSRKNRIWSNRITIDLKYLQIVGSERDLTYLHDNITHACMHIQF